MTPSRARARNADIWLLGLACALALFAIYVHVPGHVSMDSSEQLYEAHTGRSVSWSPPFMSALLRLFGGGSVATAIFVVISVLMTYAGLTLAMVAGFRRNVAPSGWRRHLAVPAIAVLVANPIVFLFVGIVWKDVMLAALLSMAAGLLLLADQAGPGLRRGLGVATLCLLVPLLLVRQQGLLLAPPLVAVAAAAIAGRWTGRGNWRWWLRWLGAVAGYALVCWAVAAGVRQMVQGTGDKSTSVGLAAVQRYDLTGMLALGGKPATVLPRGLATEEFLAAVTRSYSADRIDFVLSDAEVVEGFRGLHPDRERRAFWSLVRERPGVYLQVKAGQFAWLAGLKRLDRCLPLHVGVEGNREYLAAVQVAPGLDRYDQQLYGFGLWARHLLLYRHWFYMAVLVACIACLARPAARARAGAAIALAMALLAFYAAYAATTIACDFRYLYPGLVGVSVLAIHLLARAGARRDAALPGGPP